MALGDSFFWFGMVSCAVLLVWTVPLARRGSGQGWLVVSVAVLAVGAAGKVFFPTQIGVAVGVLWVLFIALPSTLMRAALRGGLGQRYTQAQRYAVAAGLLHPADGWRETSAIYRALALAKAGDGDRAAAILKDMVARGRAPASTVQAAQIHLYRMQGQWEELVAWTEQLTGPATAGGPPTERKGRRGPAPLDPHLLLARVRGFGETGRLSEMLGSFQQARVRLEKVSQPGLWPACQMHLFAFGGREAAVAALLDGPLAAIPASAKAFWRATAKMAAGQTEAARADFRALADGVEAHDLRRAIERRLTHDLADADKILNPAEQAVLNRVEADRVRDAAYHPQSAVGLRGSRATQLLVLLNLGAFAAEVLGGGSEDVKTLYRLGAMWPPAVVMGGEWYRLVAALFLHLGPLHLIMNLLGLIVIGPWVEKSLGRLRYLLVYLVAGIGSMAAVLGFIRWGWMPEEILVGASGAIMGLIGATGALLAVGWRRERSGLAARRLRAIGLIVAIQAVFDLLTPQVSFAAHASGVAIGFLVTPLLAPGRQLFTKVSAGITN